MGPKYVFVLQFKWDQKYLSHSLNECEKICLTVKWVRKDLLKRFKRERPKRCEFGPKKSEAKKHWGVKHVKRKWSNTTSNLFWGFYQTSKTTQLGMIWLNFCWYIDSWNILRMAFEQKNMLKNKCSFKHDWQCHLLPPVFWMIFLS